MSITGRCPDDSWAVYNDGDGFATVDVQSNDLGSITQEKNRDLQKPSPTIPNQDLNERTRGILADPEESSSESGRLGEVWLDCLHERLGEAEADNHRNYQRHSAPTTHFFLLFAHILTAAVLPSDYR